MLLENALNQLCKECQKHNTLLSFHREKNSFLSLDREFAINSDCFSPYEHLRLCDTGLYHRFKLTSILDKLPIHLYVKC